MKFADDISGPVDLRVDADGNLYYLARGAGRVARVQYSANQEPALVASWQLEETGGETASDSVGGHTARLFNGPTFVDSARPNGGNALSFDGSNDYARVADAPALDGTSQLTVALWVNASNLNTGRIRALVTKKTTSGSPAYSLYFKGPRLVVEIVGTNNRFLSNTTFATNTWYHVAVTFDSSLAQAERVTLYVNGARDKVAPETSTAIPNTAANLFFGVYPATYKNRFVGKLDDIRIYRQALDQTEVQVLANITAAAGAVALDCGCSRTAFVFAEQSSSDWSEDAVIFLRKRGRL